MDKPKEPDDPRIPPGYFAGTSLDYPQPQLAPEPAPIQVPMADRVKFDGVYEGKAEESKEKQTDPKFFQHIEQQLAEMFPEADKTVIHMVLEDKKFDFDTSLEALLQVCGDGSYIEDIKTPGETPGASAPGEEGKRGRLDRDEEDKGERLGLQIDQGVLDELAIDFHVMYPRYGGESARAS